jgi:hypothetical protein
VGYYTLLIPLAVVALLGLVLWWASNADTDKAHRKDYGLLEEVATVPSPAAARAVEARLAAAGITATTVPAEDGEHLRILVFPTDHAPAARTLLDD